MTWYSVLGNVVYHIVYYILLPFITLFRWLLIALSPVVHLGNYMISASLLPLRLVAKFEALYIYLGVAAVIGLITGSILHISSSVLISFLRLTPTPEERPLRSVAAVRAAREQKKLENVWRSSTIKGEQGKWRGEASMDQKYVEWLEKDVGKRREEGLLGQTILEEDDDSEDVF